MKKILSAILCFCILMSLSTLVVSAEEITNPFTDVKETDYYYDPVLWAVAYGVTTGTAPDAFSPNDPCTRAQVVTFLWRSQDEPEPAITENPFDDVADNAYYYKAVLWAVENGITTGTSPNAFSPETPCTRAQVVTFLCRTAGNPEPMLAENPFDDITDSAYYYKAVLWAVENNITTGTSATTFGPEETCMRAQIVTFLYRYVFAIDPLTIVAQPEDFYMSASQDTGSFTVKVSGGSAPYSYNWLVLYDNEEISPQSELSDSDSNTFTYEFSDYDFDDHRDIGVYCIITDSKGSVAESELAQVYQYTDTPLSITSQPADYYMTSSMEEANFTVCVTGGSGPYTYKWTVLYDNEEIAPQPAVSDSDSNTFTWEFSDYDFDDYNNIGVCCIITDGRGNVAESELAEVYQYTDTPLSITSQPADHHMTSSMEEASFTVSVTGGSGPYTYKWTVLYDNEEIAAQPAVSNSDSNTFTWEFSDYDFDDHRDIGVYCIITDGRGNVAESELAEVFHR